MGRQRRGRRLGDIGRGRGGRRRSARPRRARRRHLGERRRARDERQRADQRSLVQPQHRLFKNPLPRSLTHVNRARLGKPAPSRDWPLRLTRPERSGGFGRESGEAGEVRRFLAADHRLAVDIHPDMGGEPVAVAPGAVEEHRRDSAPAQHPVEREPLLEADRPPGHAGGTSRSSPNGRGGRFRDRPAPACGRRAEAAAATRRNGSRAMASEARVSAASASASMARRRGAAGCGAVW